MPLHYLYEDLSNVKEYEEVNKLLELYREKLTELQGDALRPAA